MNTERSDLEIRSLTDLHTHILPQMDDGAKHLQMAQQMLRQQKSMGVDRVMLTPHYYPLREDLGSFLQRREESYALLLSGLEENRMPELKLGAEVRYFAQLAEMDLRQLTLGGGNYLLLELSDTRLPAHIVQVVDQMLMQGITPVLAHVERCMYFRQEPDRLVELVQMGALAQVSADALKNRRDQNFAMACLKNGLGQIVASDAHDLLERVPNLKEKMNEIGQPLADRAERFARTVWDNAPPQVFSLRGVQKGLFGYH